MKRRKKLAVSNHERLTKELQQLKNNQSSLNWALNILKGVSDTDAKVLIAVKQNLGTTHEAALCDVNTEITKELINILENKNVLYLNRIDDIVHTLQSVDLLLKDK